MSKRVAIVGSRDYPNPGFVKNHVRSLPADCIVVSGGARGVDSWAEDTGRAAGLTVDVIPADWRKHGRRAGPIRNAQIVARCDRLVAFWNGESRGTLNTVIQAVEARVPTLVFGPDGNEVALEVAIRAAAKFGVVKGFSRAKAGPG